MHRKKYPSAAVRAVNKSPMPCCVNSNIFLVKEIFHAIGTQSCIIMSPPTIKLQSKGPSPIENPVGPIILKVSFPQSLTHSYPFRNRTCGTQPQPPPPPPAASIASPPPGTLSAGASPTSQTAAGATTPRKLTREEKRRLRRASIKYRRAHATREEMISQKDRSSLFETGEGNLKCRVPESFSKYRASPTGCP